MSGHPAGLVSHWQPHILPLLLKPWLQIAVLLVSAFAVHLPSLQGQLIWDDYYLVGESPFFRSPIFGIEVFRQYLVLDSFSSHYRPVQNLSYMLDYVVWNGDLYGYHLSNVLWHAGAGVLLFLLLRRVLTAWAGTDQIRRRVEVGAFLLALVWVLHPAHSAAVDYISGRADSLAFVFSCGAWLMYLRSRDCRHLLLRAIGYIGAALLMLLGLCSREIALAWVVLFVAHLLLTGSLRARHRAFVIIVCILVVAAYAGLRQLPPRRGTQPAEESWSAVARTGLMLRALGDYARITVLPTNLHMERNVSTPRMWGPRWRDQIAFNWLSALGIFTAAVLLLGSFKRGPGQRLRAFGAFWFLCGFLPVSNIVELNATVAEHWLYLPLVGLLLVFLGWGIEMPARALRIATVCVLAAAAALGVRSTIRSTDWLDPQVFYERTIKSGGWSARVALNLALIYGHHGRLDDARRLLEASLRTWPDYPLARSHLAVVLARQGATAEADRVSAQAAVAARDQKAVYPRTWTASIQRARRAVEEEQNEEALRLLAEARQAEPHAWPLAKMQSEILRRTRGPEAALPIIQEFAAKNWWQYSAHLALGKLKAQQGDSAAALAALAHASRLDIRETEALNLMARIQLADKNFVEAFATQRRAVSRQPNQPSQHILFSEVLMQMGRTEQAQKARARAQSLQDEARGPA